MSEAKSEFKLQSSDEKAVDTFKQFLRIRTISNDGPKGPNYEAVDFLRKLTEAIGFTCQVVEVVKGYPVLCASLIGSQPELPSVILNSHYDVVPVMIEKWNHDPFAAVELENGDIVARGTQDMKCVCIQYIFAMCRLLESGKRFKRSVHLTFTPDEEVGGHNGMANWVQTEEFKKLNGGFALDEGLANPTNKYTVFYGERSIMWIVVKSTGPTGHGSRFIKQTAMEKLMRAVNRFLEFRAEQLKIFEGHDGCKHAVEKKLGDVTTLNLTMLNGGVGSAAGWNLNVIPMEAEAGFDIRIPPSVNLEEFEEKIKEWTKEDGMTYEFLHKTTVNPVTSLDRNVNKLWGVFADACAKIKVELEPEIFPAGTDGRQLRCVGIPCLGFSPMNNTPIMLHEHNEFLNRKVFLSGIKVYETILADLLDSDVI